MAAGLTLLGENRVQEAEAKAPEVPGRHLAPRRPAAVQQGAPALEIFDAVQSVDSRRRSPSGSTGSPARSGRRAGARYPVLLQVNVDDDPAKAGFRAR